MTKREVRVQHRFSASSERVFDAWLDPAKAGKFLFATPEGRMVKAEIDPKVGGRFAFVDRRGSDEVEHVGEYLEISRPKRLVFNLRVPKYSSETTRVTIEIIPLGTGCELTLSHDAVVEHLENARSGWAQILIALGKVV